MTFRTYWTSSEGIGRNARTKQGAWPCDADARGDFPFFYQGKRIINNLSKLWREGTVSWSKTL